MDVVTEVAQAEVVTSIVHIIYTSAIFVFSPVYWVYTRYTGENTNIAEV